MRNSILIVALTTALAVSAQTMPEGRPQADIRYVMQPDGSFKTELGRTSDSNPYYKSQPGPAKADAKTVSLEIEVISDVEGMSIAQVCAFNDDPTSFYSKSFYDPEETKCTLDLPEGTYEIIAQYWGAFDGRGSYSYVIHERVDVREGAGTHVFRASEATNCIQFKGILPSGEPIIYDKGYTVLNPETGWYDDIVITEEGNVESNSFDTWIYSKRLDRFPYGAGGRVQLINSEGRDDSALLNIYVNDASDDYMFCCDNLVFDKQGKIYNFFMKSWSGMSTVVSNDSGNFVTYNAEFQSTPYNKEKSDNVPCYYLYEDIYFNGELLGGKLDIDYWKENIEVNSMSYTNDDKLMLSMKKIEADDFGLLIQCPGIWSPFISVIDNEVQYIPKWNNRRFSGLERLALVVPDAYLFSEKEATPVFGDSAPIFYADNANYKEPRRCNDFLCYYVGRYGEVRESDVMAMNTKIYDKGELVADQDGESLMATMEYFAQPRDYGKLEFVFTNRNVKVDGLDGYNITRVIQDDSKDDYVAPTLTMLMMRDADNKVTDRFATQQDCRIDFSVSDLWMSSNNPDIYPNTPDQEIKVKVEWSPYGKDLWNELEVEEDAEEFDIYFGHFFRASVDSVNAGSANNWYDLRVTVQDASGNMQEQTISPAFRIESLSGVQNVQEASDAPVVSRYDLQGRRVKGTELAPGIYIERLSDNSVRKLQVK